MREDGRLRCRFRRPFVSSVSSELADFSEPKHILLAKGKVDDKGNKERHVLEPNKYPYVSKQKVVLTDTDYVSIHDTARYWMVKFHGRLDLQENQVLQESTLLTPAHKGWVIVVPCAVWAAAAGIKLVGVPPPKPLHGFSPNFQGMFIPRGPRAD